MASPEYIGYEEVVVSNDKGRRLVHYYFKKAAGGFDLAVIGRERSPRHMYYTVSSEFMKSGRNFSYLKWRSRREVIDWISSFLEDCYLLEGSPLTDDFAEEYPSPSDSKSSMKARSEEFSWAGSFWICKKGLRHYKSFCRNGIIISVHDFVHVMSKDNRRLVAYLEDLYEDSRTCNMVLVRWFHRIDEIGIVLPPDSNDREIFFSLCLEDINVECIDGLASILSPRHFQNFHKKATGTQFGTYICWRQIDNDNIKPFDVTQVQGYWSQHFFRYNYSFSQKGSLKNCCSHKYKLRRFVPTVENVHNDGDSAVTLDLDNMHEPGNHFLHFAPTTGLRITRCSKQWMVGSYVEVLSQDSGIRGCWFRAKIIKSRLDKVKVQYSDVENVDKTGNLEEWVSTSKIAGSDKLGLRLSGRKTVRPYPPIVGFSGPFDVGVSVDAWWFDGWWEGIVIHKDSEDKIHVYLPGEQRISSFSSNDLRHAQDWINNKWIFIKSLSGASCKDLLRDIAVNLKKSPDCHLSQSLPSIKTNSWQDDPHPEMCKKPKVPNLIKDTRLAELKWNTCKKRRWCRENDLTKCLSDNGNSNDGRIKKHKNYKIQRYSSFSASNEHDSCKSGEHPPFSAPLSSSWVMSS